MNRERFTILLLAAALALGAAAFLSMRRNAHSDTAAGALYPNLGAQIATLNALTVRKAGPTANVTLHKAADQWVVTERHDYPADFGKLRKLMLALTDAKIVEQKTADPSNYAQIGVDDPGGTNATGTEVDFATKDGSHGLIVGKASGDGNFVRRTGEAQSYTVQPSIFVETEPRYWIDNKLFELAVNDIERIDYKPAGLSVYGVHRQPAPPPASAASAAPAPAVTPEPTFALDGVPAGRKAADSASLAPQSSVFSGLSADDVAQAAELDFSKANTTTLTLKGGTAVTFSGIVVGDKHWIEVSGVQDAAFTAKSAGRAYEIAGYRYDGIFRSLEQMLVPKEPASATKKPAEAKPLKAGKTPPSTPAP
jgi:hypothetical protein